MVASFCARTIIIYFVVDCIYTYINIYIVAKSLRPNKSFALTDLSEYMGVCVHLCACVCEKVVKLSLNFVELDFIHTVFARRITRITHFVKCDSNLGDLCSITQIRVSVVPITFNSTI